MAAPPGQLSPAERATGFRVSRSPVRTPGSWWAMAASSCGPRMAALPGRLSPAAIAGPSMRFPLTMRAPERRSAPAARSCGPPTSAPPGHKTRAARRARFLPSPSPMPAPEPPLETGARSCGPRIGAPRGNAVPERYLQHSHRGLLHGFEYRNRSRRERHDSAHHGRGCHVDASVQRHDQLALGRLIYRCRHGNRGG